MRAKQQSFRFYFAANDHISFQQIFHYNFSSILCVCVRVCVIGAHAAQTAHNEIYRFRLRLVFDGIEIEILFWFWLRAFVE